MAFAIKAEIRETHARSFAFAGQKTMYGGKSIAEGDTIFLFVSENEGGQGLIAQGVVTSVTPIARKPAIPRQAPCVSISVNRTGVAKRPLGRSELNFKFYRQATNKIIGISDEMAAFLRG
jgi:hypothetical protein